LFGFLKRMRCTWLYSNQVEQSMNVLSLTHLILFRTQARARAYYQARYSVQAWFIKFLSNRNGARASQLT
jgi:hypothetical protein